MPVSERVIVELEARLGRYEANVARAERKFDAAMGSIQRSATATEGLVGRAMSGITGALAGVSVIALARTFLEIADAAKNLDAQLRLATNGFGSFSQAQQDVRRIAADTRSGLAETAALYGNFSRGAKELGADQEAAARATETFTKTLKISGADANQAASATLQFGQALAAGALRGDELNSILEASPRLARLLAESFGMPIGKIKELGEEGKLTSDKLLDALTNRKFTEGVDREFRELPVTFGDAMTQIENAAIITFGAFDRGGQFSTALANFVMDGKDGFEDMEASAVEAGIGIRAAIEGLAGSFGPILSEAQAFFNYVNTELRNLSGGRIDFSSKGVNIGRDIDKSLGQIDAVTDWFANKSYIGQKLNGTSFDIGGSNLQGRYRQGRDAAESRLRGELGERAASDIVGQYFDRFGNPARNSRGASPSGPSDAEKKKAAAAARKAAAEARRAEAERLRAIREDASNARDAASLQDDINAARAALAVAAEDVLRFNLQSIESEKQQRTAEYETRFKLGQISQQELSDRIAAVNEIADLQAQREQQLYAEIRRQEDLSRAQAGIRDNSDLLRAQADLVDSRKARRDIELRLLDLAYEQERNELEAVIASGTATAAQKEIAEQRLRILGQLKGYDAERISRDVEGPLARYRRDLGNPDRSRDEVEDAVVGELESVRDGISSAVQKALGVKNPILAALINSFIEQQLIKPIMDGVAGASGGGGFFGSVVGAIGGLFGGGRAIGGPVRAGVAYDVGENGRERFIPQQAGVIVPNHRLKGNRGGNTVISAPQFNLAGAVITTELYADMQRISEQSAARAGSRAYQQSMKDAPGAVSRRQRYG
ncbi:tape measure protein [Novosphingobium sp. HII-3]|uniref:tape measure protein n=1 Tax=Novosphingobium sp. HII-3 TaxID=2075565 RepID=UPI000CDABB1C|nr:tape measure protein [Novosphingobium sp. HII-3]